MALIAVNEFQIMLREFERNDEHRWESLCHITDKFCKPMVYSWYAKLGGKDNAKDVEDYYHSVLIKIVKSVDMFFKRQDESEDVEIRLRRFAAWLKVVTQNELIDQAAEIYKNGNVTSMDDENFIEVAAAVADDISEEQARVLNASFRVVMNSGWEVYKVLSWLCLSVLMIAMGDDKKNITQYMESEFSNLSLGTMYDVVIRASKKILWLRMEQDDTRKVELALAEPYTDGRVYSQVIFSEFFMKAGGKKSIADWFNKFAKKIGKEVWKWII